MFLLSPEADMRPGDLQAQFRGKCVFGLLTGRQDSVWLRDFWRTRAVPYCDSAHWSHTDYCGITRKRRFLTRRQSSGKRPLCQ